MRPAITALLCCGAALVCDGFTVRRTLTMKRRLLSEGKKKKNKARKVTLTKVPGITAPEEKKLKGWALEVAGSESVRLTAGTCNGKLYVLEAACGCCAWDLEKGDLRGSVTGEPSVACGLCGQTYSLVTGEPGGAVEKQPTPVNSAKREQEKTKSRKRL